MSDPMSEHSCYNCLFDPSCIKEAKKPHGWCASWERAIKSNPTFAGLIKEALPKDKDPKKFSLDQLIDDHWKYNEGLVKLCFPYGVDGWETDDILRLVEFAYKQSGKHFWKHCKEHYNIEGESNE